MNDKINTKVNNFNKIDKNIVCDNSLFDYDKWYDCKELLDKIVSMKNKNIILFFEFSVDSLPFTKKSTSFNNSEDLINYLKSCDEQCNICDFDPYIISLKTNEQVHIKHMEWWGANF